MPWSNNSGGGDNKGPWGNPGGGKGGGGGPWGNGPSGGNGGGGNRGGNQPPDLEEILRKGQDRIKQVIPGGGAPNMLMMVIIGIFAIGAWLTQAFYQIQPNQLGVELLFGKPKAEISNAGLHFHWWPVETVEVAQVSEERIVIGGVSTRGSAGAGLMLSGDQNIVEVEFAALWQMVDPNAFLFNVEDPKEMVTKVAESAMREVVGRGLAQDIFRDKRAAISEEVRSITQATLESYGTGIQINRITIENVAPPREVADAFDEVQRAEQDEDRFVEEANRYSNQKLGAARGQSATIREGAAAYKTRVVEEAKGEAQRFVSIYNEYSKSPDVTRKRLFLETMERVLRGSNKVILGSDAAGGQGVVPYLPLPEIQKRAVGASNPTKEQ